MKTHQQFADDLALYALNELTGSERQEFEQHLETCASCRREVQALRGDLGLLALSIVGPNPPARSKDRLMRAIAEEPRGVSAAVAEKARRRGFGWAWIPTLVGVALLLAAVAIAACLVPAMRAARAGKLIGIASVAGFRGVPGAGAYSASKAAAIAYLESLPASCEAAVSK